MKEPKYICACIYDHGLFIPLAQKLAKTYKRVLYHTHAEKGFTLLNDCVIGDGFPDIERCDDIWKVKDDVDLFIFPDIQHSGLQLELAGQGYPVWGSRTGDSLEIIREKFHKVLAKVGLEVPKFTRVIGLTKLAEYVADKENLYIKISRFRGTMETTHWRDWDMDEGWLDSMAVKLGPMKEKVPFLVFDPIETDLEIGGDTYCIDGFFPSLMMHGLEWKDKGYLGAMTPKDKMPQQIQDVLEAFSPVLAEHNYRNFWSMELRVKDDKSFFIDPCCRGPLPATGAQIELYSNLAEIIYYGAMGQLVDPIPSADFAAECVITSKGSKHEWGKVRMPKELADKAKFGGCCEVDGAICFPPDDSHGDEIGWLVNTANSMKEVVEGMLELKSLLPDGVSANTDSLVNLLKEAHSAEEQDIEFSDDKVPDPLIAVET